MSITSQLNDSAILVDVVAIKAKTDNLPSDPADQSAVEAKIDSTESDIRGADSDTLKILSDQIDSVQSSVNNIQNNTRLTVSVPVNIIIPSAGSTPTRMFINLYDSVGNTEDPDSNIMAVVLSQTTGVDITTRLFKDLALTVALDAIVGGTFNGLKKLERDSQGRYFCFYKCSSTDTEESINAQFRYEEGTLLQNADRSICIIESPVDVTTIVTAIQAKTDNLPSDPADESLLEAAIVVTNGKVDAVKTVVDNIYGVVDTEIADIAGQIALIPNNDSAVYTNSSTTYVTGDGEQTILEDTATTRRVIHSIWLDLAAMTQAGTIKVSYKIWSTTYRVIITQTYDPAIDSPGIFIDLNMGVSKAFKVTYEENVAEGADRAVRYAYLTTIL